MAASTYVRSSVSCDCKAPMRAENSPCMERTAARAAAVGSGIDQIGDGFRLNYVHLAVQERALAEFARPGHPAPKVQQPLQQQVHDERAPMALQLQDVFPGEGCGRREK